MNSIDLADVSRELPELIEKVGQGEEFLIVKDGETVAKLVPQGAGEKVYGPESMSDEEWKAAHRHMMALLKEGADLGGLKIDREELYGRGDMKIIA